MVTRHYLVTWDLERCVGCQIGPLVCPKEAVTVVPAQLEDGRVVKKPAVDIDAEACILCGMCAVICPTNAITFSVNGDDSLNANPVIAHEAFPRLQESTTFNEEAFDWSRRDFVIENCPTDVISYDEQQETLVVDDVHCIRCRQCEIASDGAFQVVQPWQGSVVLQRAKCVDGCVACADVCPTRALHIDDDGNLALADYYCIKCGACMKVCPIKPEVEETTETFESQGVTRSVTHQRITNREQLPIVVERWRIRHEPVQSAAWLEALTKMADEHAGAVEIDGRRALKRRDLLKALTGSQAFFRVEEQSEE